MAQSTAEAEFVVAAATVNQAIWLRKLMEGLQQNEEESTEIFVDNQVVIAILVDNEEEPNISISSFTS